MKPTLVTGATGFIGRYVVRRLLAEGIPVRVLVRNPGKLEPEVQGRVEVVAGEAFDPGIVAPAMRGVEAVLHLAAVARAWTPDPGEIRDVNVGLVGRLLDAAEREGVHAFVHTSSVLGLPPYRPASIRGGGLRSTLYEETKREADELVRARAASGFPALLVRPTRVFGPGELNDANGVTKMIDLFLRGRFRFRIDDGDVLANYVHVEDVAQGMVGALLHGRPGGDYLLGGENVSLREFLERVERIAGVRRRVATLSPRAALGTAALAEAWGHLGGTPSLTRSWIRVFLEDRRADSEAARIDFDYRPRSLARGLSETIAWLRRAEHRQGHPARGGRERRVTS